MTFKLTVLEGNTQKLDGGAMFGNAPKGMWEKWHPADKLNRIDLKCRSLLIETQSRKILLEVGIGNFFAPKFKDRYGVQEEENKLLSSLKDISLRHEDITDVIISHLHFDHAGGLLSQYQENQASKLLFPNANFYVSKEAFNRSKLPHPRDRASFIPELPQLLEDSKRLILIDSEKEKTLPDFLSFSFSHGHTPGLLLTQIHNYQLNQSMIFTSDLIPGAAWVHLPITMGYDRFPELIIDEKRMLLEKSVREQSWFFFTHDPTVSTCQVGQDEKKRFKAINKRGSFTEISWPSNA